jgi:hypothetical protein
MPGEPVLDHDGGSRTSTNAGLPSVGGPSPLPGDARTVLGLGMTPWVAASLVTAVLLGFADRYGFHRDELYFRITGQHLAFGYADQPPFTPLIARLEGALFGDSPVALRVWPALVTGAVVLMGALLCREFGGGRRAQAVVAVALAASPGLLLAGHTLSTETTDLLVWQVIGLLAVRALRTGRLRLWVLIGAVVGIGLQNKDLSAFLAVALVIGLVISRRWEVLGSRWLWFGAALMLVIAAPALIWQATHGFPQYDVAQAQRHGTGVAEYLALQLIVLNPALIPAEVRGIRHLWTERRYRPLFWAFVLLEVFFLLSGGKPYYPAAILPLVAAAGLSATPALNAAAASGQRRVARRSAARYAIIAAFGLLLAPAVLPVLPEATFAASPYAGQDDARATIGWPQLAAQVDAVAAELPASLADHGVILTQDYGEAGALERFGRSRLPVVSGHNSLWYYARPAADVTTVLAVGYAPQQLAHRFRTCRAEAVLHTPFGLDNQEDGAPVLLCTGPSRPWSTLWPLLRHDN